MKNFNQYSFICDHAECHEANVAFWAYACRDGSKRDNYPAVCCHEQAKKLQQAEVRAKERKP